MVADHPMYCFICLVLDCWGFAVMKTRAKRARALPLRGPADQHARSIVDGENLEGSKSEERRKRRVKGRRRRRKGKKKKRERERNGP